MGHLGYQAAIAHMNELRASADRARRASQPRRRGRPRPGSHVWLAGRGPRVLGRRREPADLQSSEINEFEHDFAQTVALANGRALRVVADAPDSVRLEESQTDLAPTYSVVLTNRDMYNLWNAMVEALRRTGIPEARASD